MPIGEMLVSKPRVAVNFLPGHTKWKIAGTTFVEIVEESPGAVVRWVWVQGREPPPCPIGVKRLAGRGCRQSIGVDRLPERVDSSSSAVLIGSAEMVEKPGERLRDVS